MKILILGYDGYIGYPLTLNLLKQDHTVFCIDNYSRRKYVNDIGSDSLTPIQSAQGRRYGLKHEGVVDCVDIYLGIDQPNFIKSVLRDFKPEVIVHLAEQPSAPFSMIDANHASDTQLDNVIGTLHLLWAMKEECPNAHLIKLGTMGEYGTPNCDIPEGEIPRYCLENDPAATWDCPLQGLTFPRTAGSWYHLSKVHDTHNIIFACKTWGLRSTDIMQGVVFGLNDDDAHITRFDYDQYFGTVINRFCVQSIINHPLTVYGAGGQTRGYLPLFESLHCLNLAINNPPNRGEYRTFNQFGYLFTVSQLAEKVKYAAKNLGLHVGISHLENPRAEMEDHYYNPANNKLKALGYNPVANIDTEITSLICRLIPFKNNIKEEVIDPTTRWK